MGKLTYLSLIILGLSLLISASAILPNQAHAQDACSLRAAKVGNSYTFYTSSPNYTGDSGKDLPRITVLSTISFNETGSNIAGRNYGWDEVEGQWNPYNQTWSFSLQPGMDGYDQVDAAAKSNSGAGIDGRTGSNYCNEDNNYHQQFYVPQELKTQCHTTTADVYSSPVCQKERTEYQAIMAADLCSFVSGEVKSNCMKREFCRGVTGVNTTACLNNLDSGVLSAISQAQAGLLQQKQQQAVQSVANTGELARVAMICGQLPDATDCTAKARQCLKDDAKDPIACVDQKICQQTKGAVYTAFFKRPASEGSSLSTSCFTLPQFIPTLLSYFMMFAAIIAGFFFIWASYKYLTSKGDPTALAEARDMIMQIVIGLVILMLSYVIIEVLNSAFNGVDSSILLI